MNQGHTKQRRVSRDDRVQVGDSIQSQVELARVAITRFMKERRVEDVAPLCSRVLVLDVRLALSDAFGALLEQQSSVAVLWDTVKQSLVGLLTPADLAEMLLFLRESLQREGTPTPNDGNEQGHQDSGAVDDADYNRRAVRLLTSRTLGTWLELCSEQSNQSKLLSRDITDTGQGPVPGAGAAEAPPVTLATAVAFAGSALEKHAPLLANSRPPRPSALQLISCRANGSLYEAAVLLRDHAIHHVPLVIGADSTVLCILTHGRLLAYMNEQFGLYRLEKQWQQQQQQQQQQRERPARPRTDARVSAQELQTAALDAMRTSCTPEVEELAVVVDLFSVPIETLGIGTFRNISQVHLKEPLWRAIAKLVDSNVHAIPVVDDTGALQQVYTRADALWIIAPETVTVPEGRPASPWGRPSETKSPGGNMENIGARIASGGGRYHMLRDHVLVEDHFRMLRREGRNRRLPVTCSPRDTLRTVFERMGHDFRIHQVFVVDDRQHVLGVISLSDILEFFMDSSASVPSSPDLRHHDSPFSHTGMDLPVRPIL
jgi:CBS domain-containing protein